MGKDHLVRPDLRLLEEPEKATAGTKRTLFIHRSNAGGGKWQYFRSLPQKWNIQYEGLDLGGQPHLNTPAFSPQQAVTEPAIPQGHRRGSDLKALNLFGYTGVVQRLPVRLAGASVCHCGLKQGHGECKRCCKQSERPPHPRWIVGTTAQLCCPRKSAVATATMPIMDPPSYGAGPGGEAWKLEEQIMILITCVPRYQP